MAEAEVVVHQKLMPTEVFHVIGAVDPAAGSHEVRAKSEMALGVLDDGRSVKAVAAYGCSWITFQDAAISTADLALAPEPEPVAVLGIDETQRGKAKWESHCAEAGARRWVDRWDTGLVPRPIVAALQTGLIYAHTEGYSRIVKHIGRIAFGFRNPDNHRPRVR